MPKKRPSDLDIKPFFLLALILTVSLSGTHVSVQEKAAIICFDCHDIMAEDHKVNPHSSIDTKNIAAEYNAEYSCAVCHLEWENHLEEGGGTDTILGFNNTELPSIKNQQCLQCHSRSHPRFSASPHGQSSLDCTACHIIHAPIPNQTLLKTEPSQACYGCHNDVLAQFQLNERHRLQEGILSCTSCHDPHEPSARERLGGFKHQACLQCHTDKGGPFLYEHGASRIEGCTACHEVHGSPNRHMLTHQSISDLCFSCHTFAPAWHSRFTHDTSNCTTCHSSIHGSNLDRIFLK